MPKARVALGAAPILQPSDATASSVHFPDAAEQFGWDVEEPEIANEINLDANDIVIAVVGPTGSGKSTFVHIASGGNTNEISHTLGPDGCQITAVRFWDEESGRHIVLLDTPGFNDASKSHLDIISGWLTSRYDKNKLLSGIFYLHRITNRNAKSPSPKDIRAFRDLCQKDVLDRVYLTTTTWNEVKSSIDEKSQELKIGFRRTPGAQVACWGGDDSPKELVRQVIRSECSPRIDAHSGTSLPQPLPVETRQGFFSFSHVQAKLQKYEILRRVPILQPPVETRRGSSSSVQEEPPQNRVHEEPKQTRTDRESAHPGSSESLDTTDTGVPYRTHSSSNIVIFGEAGVGKSSVINLIAGKNVAKTSPDAWGCTLDSEQYTFQVAQKTFNIWDTVGLGEPIFSDTDYLGAIEKTYSLIQEISAKGGLDLLLFCIPGSGSRFSQTMLSNYRLFFEVLCEKRIPIALVVTHLECEAKMDDWWTRNARYITRCGLKFSGHACVTGLSGHEKEVEGRDALEHLLLDYDGRGRYTMPSASDWHIDFLSRLASGIIPRPKKVKDKRKHLERILRDRCMMHATVAQRLAEALTTTQDQVT